MNRIDRIHKIIEFLEEHGNVSTAFLASTLGVSESSIRRDIQHITSAPRYKDVKPVHGGLVLEREGVGAEYMFELRLKFEENAKRAIANKAKEFIKNGDHIVLDSGTTCLYLARTLHTFEALTIITLDVKIAEELGKHEQIECNVIGGVVRPGFYSIGGAAALENLDRYTVGKLFMSADAVDTEHGLTNTTDFEVAVKRKIISKAREVFLIVDRAKLNTHKLHRVAPLSEVDTLITDGDWESGLLGGNTNSEVVFA